MSNKLGLTNAFLWSPAINLLNRVDFPTFGLPIRTTDGRLRVFIGPWIVSSTLFSLFSTLSFNFDVCLGVEDFDEGGLVFAKPAKYRMKVSPLVLFDEEGQKGFLNSEVDNANFAVWRHLTRILLFKFEIIVGK